MFRIIKAEVVNPMNEDRLIKNITDQIKEAQIKLGYAEETLRFYYPVSSLNVILGTACEDENTMIAELRDNSRFRNTVLGEFTFTVRSGRIEVSVMPQGAEYVYKKVEDPPFLVDIINLFKENHHCGIEDIKEIFGRYSNDYVCEKMQEGMEFDYVMHFKDTEIDEYYYCIKAEMGHTVYHRFSKEDYQQLFKQNGIT